MTVMHEPGRRRQVLLLSRILIAVVGAGTVLVLLLPGTLPALGLTTGGRLTLTSVTRLFTYWLVQPSLRYGVAMCVCLYIGARFMKSRMSARQFAGMALVSTLGVGALYYLLYPGVTIVVGAWPIAYAVNGAAFVIGRHAWRSIDTMGRLYVILLGVFILARALGIFTAQLPALAVVSALPILLGAAAARWSRSARAASVATA